MFPLRLGFDKFSMPNTAVVFIEVDIVNFLMHSLVFVYFVRVEKELDNDYSVQSDQSYPCHIVSIGRTFVVYK